MSQAVYEILFFFAIIAVIVVHEAGHFVAAKACKMKVEEFFVGFGPRLWSTRRGETEYGVKALPFGGYVRIAGMNPFQEPTAEEAPRTFGAKPVWQRAVVIGTGPVTHFVMAILLLGVYFSAIGVAARFRPSVDAVETQLNGHRSPAATAGFRPGDVIVAVDGQPLSPTSDPARAQDQAGRSIRQNKGMVMSITVLR